MAFWYCYALKTATFNAATTIEANAFDGCTSLVTLTLYATPPTKVNTGMFAFGNRQCNLVIVREDGETPLVGNALKRHKLLL